MRHDQGSVRGGRFCRRKWIWVHPVLFLHVSFLFFFSQHAHKFAFSHDYYFQGCSVTGCAFFKCVCGVECTGRRGDRKDRFGHSWWRTLSGDLPDTVYECGSSQNSTSTTVELVVFDEENGWVGRASRRMEVHIHMILVGPSSLWGTFMLKWLDATC